MVPLCAQETVAVSCLSLAASVHTRARPLFPFVVSNAAFSDHSGSARCSLACVAVAVCLCECIYVDSVCSGQAHGGSPAGFRRQSVTVWTVVCSN